jgi:hypothetical protein
VQVVGAHGAGVEDDGVEEVNLALAEPAPTPNGATKSTRPSRVRLVGSGGESLLVSGAKHQRLQLVVRAKPLLCFFCVFIKHAI